MSEEQFWAVWNPAHGEPTVRHSSFEIAKAEAERLARFNPGQKFYVLAACGVARRVDVTFEPITADDEFHWPPAT